MGREFLSDLRLESAPSRAKRHMDMICVDIAIQEILDPIKQTAHSKNAAQSYIDAFKIEKTGFIKIELVNDHRFSGWLEYGTPPHTIEGNPLAFDIDGDTVFAKKVNHPGFEGYHILKDNLPALSTNYARRLSEDTTKFLERTRMR